MKKLALLIMASAMMVGCSQETAILSEPDVALAAEETPLLNTKEGVERAIKAHADFYGTAPKTLSRSNEKSSVRLYGASSSRTEEMSNPLYIVNFDDGGFVIVSALRDADGTPYAASETNSFDETGNPVLQNYLYDLASSEPMVGPQRSGWVDSIPAEESNDIIPPGFRPLHLGSDTLVRDTPVHEIADFKVNTKWGQTYPYSKFTPNGYPAGCVAVAISQICAFEHFPKSVGGYAMDYDEITASPYAADLKPEQQDQVGHLIHEVGVLANTEYSSTLSTATFDNTKSAFQQLGYDMETIYSYDKCLDYLFEMKSPAFITALSCNAITPFEFSWVVSGARTYFAEEYYIRRYTLEDIGLQWCHTSKFLKFNWGMNGVSDGDYKYYEKRYDKSNGWSTEYTYRFRFTPVGSTNSTLLGSDSRILIKSSGIK